jgi:serine/threonine protein kinase
MIRQTEEPAPETLPEAVLAGYRLDPSPRRREGGSLLFSAMAPDGSPSTIQVSSEPVANRRARSRFRRLARTRAQLAHPALLGVRETGEEGGRVFVATDLFPPRSLADLLRGGPLDADLALKLLTAVADGLDAAHAAGLVHRTLSPESVLLDGDRVKLDLFGLFTVMGQPDWGDVVRRDAHLHYDSPEAVRGDELSRESNVYSLAGLLFHALTGEQPFPHHDPVMITYAHVSQPPPKLSERRPELPSGLDAIVARGMAKEPGERPESAGELIGDAAVVLRMASYATPKPAPREPAVREPASPEPAAAPPMPVPASQKAPEPSPPVPKAPEPVTAKLVPPALPAEAPARPRAPLSAWLVPLAPLLLVLAVAAVFGVLLGMPSSEPQQTANTVRSPEERALERLDGVRFRLRDDLAFAATGDEQADLAQRLATAYGKAADDLSSPELVSAAETASAAYLSLERAARAEDEDAYDVARGDVESAESRIAISLAPSNSQTERK